MGADTHTGRRRQAKLQRHTNPPGAIAHQTKPSRARPFPPNTRTLHGVPLCRAQSRQRSGRAGVVLQAVGKSHGPQCRLPKPLEPPALARLERMDGLGVHALRVGAPLQSAARRAATARAPHRLHGQAQQPQVVARPQQAVALAAAGLLLRHLARRTASRLWDGLAAAEAADAMVASHRTRSGAARAVRSGRRRQVRRRGRLVPGGRAPSQRSAACRLRDGRESRV